MDRKEKVKGGVLRITNVTATFTHLVRLGLFMVRATSCVHSTAHTVDRKRGVRRCIVAADVMRNC